MSRGRRRAPYKIKLKKETLYSVATLCLFALGLLTIVSFSRQQIILTKLNLLLFAYFGWGAFFLPFLIILSGLMLTKLKWKICQPNVFVGSFLLFVSFLSLTRAGIFGRNLWYTISSYISQLGAFFLALGASVIGLTVLFDASIEDVILFSLDFIRKTRLKLQKIKAPKPLFDKSKPLLRVTGQEEISQKSKEQSSLKTPSSGSPAPLVTNLPAQEQIWEPPPLSLLADKVSAEADRGDIKQNAASIENLLESFGIEARVVEVNGGPAVTQYALEISLGTKLSKITALQNDLALALAAPTGQIRIEAPIPGRSLVGVEIPNRTLEFVTLKKMLTSDAMKKSKSKLTVSLGLDVSGKARVADIARMPHVLIAGATGSGKTVCLNTFIASILFRTSPEEVKFILIDPKRVELTQYNGTPHLLTPVIVDAEKVISALKWAIIEMDRRYKLFAETGVRNIDYYNELSGFQALPYVIIIIDELADIILFAPAEVEDFICRIAQMARATGIHLVISTQRPSVDVLTGLIKANIPCRIAFNVSSMVDSRVILDTPGAEKLIGRGDMLYIPPDQAKPTRIQGAYVSEPEIQNLINFLRGTGIKPHYTEEVTAMPTGAYQKGKFVSKEEEERDDFFEDALRTVCQYDRASASLLQRRLKIGYARAARILDQLEHAGVVGPAEGSKPRDVLTRNPEEILSTTPNTN
jgi:S-DNA-T family DNA segregation ATPase FtsK/SpoIIIE